MLQDDWLLCLLNFVNWGASICFSSLYHPQTYVFVFLLGSVQHVPKINGEIPSLDEATLDHQRLLDRYWFLIILDKEYPVDVFFFLFSFLFIFLLLIFHLSRSLHLCLLLWFCSNFVLCLLVCTIKAVNVCSSIDCSYLIWWSLKFKEMVTVRLAI